MGADPENDFKFEISLSVLNHLGRNLYRNFITVLGEAISNAWDADAEKVHIIINRRTNDFVIKDDGIGMESDDFQHKFLKIGYSKRKEGETKSEKGRPYIGAKGIGKLALLSCSDVVSIISKKEGGDYVGGKISNEELDKAIENEVASSEYALGEVDMEKYGPFIQNHRRGTVIDFIGTREDIKGSIEQIRKLIALYFRFSLIDDSFDIFLNGQKISLEDIKDLSESTQFLWAINDFADPIYDTFTELEYEKIKLKSKLAIKGFIASVKKPRNLKIRGAADEKIGIDLFVNGRLREKDIMKHIPTARITEDYLYGQIHFDELDGDGVDRFTSSREGVVASDKKYQEFLIEMKNNVIPRVFEQWDELRRSEGEDGDDDAGGKTEKERRAARLFQLSADEYTSGARGENKDLVDKWVDKIRPDAEFNLPAYADCFVTENLTRYFINHHKIEPIDDMANRSADFKTQEEKYKQDANISFDIRRSEDVLSFLDFNDLSFTIEKEGKDWKKASLMRDSMEYKPIRNAMGHTGLLTDDAKAKLRLIFANVSGRLRYLLRGNP
tara:strand:+ start:1299 stop:2966 length:1668 start_codon:yes stop_codon:yes gene_type:complete